MPDDSTETPSGLDSGQMIGSYRLLGKLGEGGVGVVYEAQHTRLSRRAAVKVLRPEYSARPEMVRRFFNEAESVNLVQHPGIVTIFEFGQLPEQDGNTAFIVMEYLDGETLRARLRKGGGGMGGLRLIRQIASALAAAHARGIIHRDLKPENIMIVSDPDVPGGERTKIVDFGIAKMTTAVAQAGEDLFRTQAGQVMGTPAYMSPEQLRDTGAVDDRADVYSLGVMLYELVAGRLPFSAVGYAELVGMHLFSTPPPLKALDATLPIDLCQLVDRMLAKDPGARPSMADVLSALEAFGAPSSASMLPPVAAAPQRRLWPLALLGAAVLVGGAGAVVYHRLVAPPRKGGLAAPVPSPGPKNEASAPPVDLSALRDSALAVFREGLRDPDSGMRRRGAALLAQSRDSRTGALLLPLLSDSEPGVQAQAAQALSQLGVRSAAPALLSLLKERGAPEELRLQAAGGLLLLGDERAERAGERVLGKALRASDEGLRERAATLLGERGNRRAREIILHGELRDEEHITLLGRLSRFGDAAARQALKRGLPDESAGAMTELQLRTAEELARGDDQQARAVLESVARANGPNSMRAARLLASLDDPSFYERFTTCFPLVSCPLSDRLLSAEGLGAYGRKDAAPLLLSSLPADPKRTLRLRLAAAGAALQIAARDPEFVASIGLDVVTEGLKDAARPQREDAAEALGDAEPRLAVPLLQGALKDEAPEVRRSAAQALGRTRARAAVPVLGEALDDAAGVVRKEAMDSMGRVGEHLRKHGEPVEDVVQAVAGHVGKGDASERLSGIAALLRLGSGERREALLEQLRPWLRSGDAQIRRQAIEAWRADPTADGEVLVAAIGDRAFSVRFAAAVGLGDRGRREGVPVLVQALGMSSPDALIARGLLRRLGLATPGAVVLGGGPPSERAAMVSAAAYLPAEEALALLRQAAHDIAARVRLRVVSVFGDLPELARSRLGRQLLRVLLADRDALVRARAGLLFGHLGLRPEDPPPAAAPAPAPDLGEAPDLSESAPVQDLAPAAATHRGHLQVEADAEIRFQIDQRPQQTAPVRPLSLSPGKHRVSYAGGVLEVEVVAGETVTARIPLSLGEQALADAEAAFAAGDLDRAQQLLARAQGALPRGAGKDRWFSLLYHQGRINEAQGRYIDAMSGYEKLGRKVSDRDRSAAQKAQLDEAIARVASKLGRVRIGKEVDGKCQTTELWLPPGSHFIDVGGDSREVRVRAGETIKVQACD